MKDYFTKILKCIVKIYSSKKRKWLIGQGNW
jgi:hypothetical protein